MSSSITVAYWRLARALYGAYGAHSNGRAHDGRGLPSWSEIQEREHAAVDTPMHRRTTPRYDGVLGHWQHLAILVAPSSEHAEAMARAIEERHQNDEVFCRLAS